VTNIREKKQKMFSNPKGELKICPNCKRQHDILRGTGCICACGTIILSKEFSLKKTISYLDYNLKDE